MPAEGATLRDDELTRFLDVSRRVLGRASVRLPTGPLLLATPPDGFDPRRDLRTLAAAIVALAELGDLQSARVFGLSLIAQQDPTGGWSANPAEQNGRSGGEDVTALALWAMMSYVRLSGDQGFAELARDAVDEAVRYTRATTLNPYLYLIESSGSLYGPSLGYELWTNCAHAAAFALCHRVYGGERHRRLALLIRRSIGQLLTADGRFLRRLDPNGNPDTRPDVCLIAPYYFKLWAPTERMVMNSSDLIERALWNVEIGGYVRLLPYSAAERAGLPGPSPRFSAWMAQYHYDMGNRDRAEAIVRWLFDHARDGELCDVLLPSQAASRYLPEQRRLLAATNPADRSSDQRRLAWELERVESALEQGETVASGLPLVWAHLETLRALQRGGYLDYWQLDQLPARLGEGQMS